MIISVEFVGPYAAADVGFPSVAEWPPHPDRLFQAFVDAAHLSESDELAALRWLEAQPAPGIACGEAVFMATAETFVPVNYPDAHPLPEQRIRQPRSFPLAWPKENVDFVWPDPDPPILAALSKIAGRVSHVGRAESVCLAEVLQADVKPVWSPRAEGGLSLRVPHAGRLDQLEQAFRSGRYGPTAPAVPYGRVDDQAVIGPWGEMVVVRLRHALSVENLVTATEALRQAVLSRLGDAAPASAHGHGRHDHLAWLGLPNLSPYARGELLGLAMLLPRQIDPRERAQCLRALLAVDHIMPEGRRVDVAPPTPALSLASATWSRPAQVWESISPVVLDRYPRRNLSLEEVLADSVERAGYPRPLRVDVIDRGAASQPVARRFRLRKPGRLYTHIRIEFDVPVKGPLLVGAERYFGLGLFLPRSNARTPIEGENPSGSRQVSAGLGG